MNWWQVNPKELPELDILEDILIDIKDTDEYQSGNIVLSLYPSRPGDSTHLTSNNEKPVESKRVIVYEADMPKIEPYDFDIEGDLFGMPTTIPSIGIKKIEYEVTKLLVVLSIELFNVSLETKHLVHETVKRIEDYVTDDNLIDVNHRFSKIDLKTSIYKYKFLGSSVN